MINPFKEVNWSPGWAERRSFAISLIVGFPCVAAALLLVHRWSSGQWSMGFPLWLAGAGAAVGIVLWLVPSFARPVYVAWYFLGCCIGFVVSNILLSAFYYVAVTAMGLAMRAAGKSRLPMRFDKSKPTYWVDARQVNDPKRYFNQF